MSYIYLNRVYTHIYSVKELLYVSHSHIKMSSASRYYFGIPDEALFLFDLISEKLTFDAKGAVLKSSG